jgi:hypothetical protein
MEIAEGGSHWGRPDSTNIRAYTHFFEAGSKRVKISRKDGWKQDEMYLFLV